MRNSLTLLNENGDTSISWDEENDEKMVAMIRKKMSEGMTFFIVEPRFFNLVPMKVKLKDVDSIKDRQVFLKDNDFNDLILNGTANVYKRESSGYTDTVKRVEKAEEVQNNHVVGINPRKGG